MAIPEPTGGLEFAMFFLESPTWISDDARTCWRPEDWQSTSLGIACGNGFSSRRGFPMIKIQRFRICDLVTIAVLLVLFSFLLFSQPRRGRGHASLSNCTGNLKQLGNAGALYEGDNEGGRPGPQPMGMAISKVSWDRLLAIQMGAALGIAGVYEPVDNLATPHTASKTLATFTCPQENLKLPGARIVLKVPGSFADGTAGGPGICRSFTLNLGSGNLVAAQDDGIAATANVIPLAKVESGAGTVCLIENHGYATAFGQRNIANDTTIVGTKAGVVVPKDAFTNASEPMHGTKTRPRVNALMYDGHVEVLEQDAVVASGCQIMQYGREGQAEKVAK
jgi:prepilin-type processing-associated H-X9-DG protein